jgi:Skp family chaperone for outer membrane proteins
MFGMSGMRRTVLSASLVLTCSAAPAFAQARGAAPAAPARGQAPPPAPMPAPAAQPPAVPVPFPAGAKIAFVNLQAIAQESVDGKASAAKVQKTVADKQTEAGNRAKALQANQQKLQTSGGVMTEAARSQIEKDIASQQRDNDRFDQDAQAEVNDLQQTLQNDLLKKLFPVLEDLRKERELWVIFSAADAGVIVADNGLDLTLDAVKRMDAKK